MKKDLEVFLEHILAEIEKIERHITTNSQFLHDENLQDATVRRLEIIGEAVKNLPPSFREKYTEIAWKDFAGLRDKLIHQYFGVNLNTVWHIVLEDLPRLKKVIEISLKELKN
ncbi:DUF86 domain-containing protein [Candidatus Woesearchaeota archaeon]|nr:DUF86 domain-containing protein [Candidatus Woesearchaeota archaeon]